MLVLVQVQEALAELLGNGYARPLILTIELLGRSSAQRLCLQDHMMSYDVGQNKPSCCSIHRFQNHEMHCYQDTIARALVPILYSCQQLPSVSCL